MDKDSIRSILVTDCGSTTTKAILIEKQGDEFRLVVRGEAPTTVEAPAEDVTLGVRNAALEVGELVDRPILDGEGNFIKPYNGKEGIDIYLSTSSAGGGLQMMVAGVVAKMSSESAQRAALGAGAVVMEVLSSNDKRLPYEKIELIRKLRPDMVLLSGGVDGGVQKHVVEMAQLFGAADPRPRLGINYKLPIIFAGNKDVRSQITKILGEKTALEIVDNIRPTLDRENLQPARLKIQKQFLEHVMAHAPGYPNLMKMADEDIMPTPAAVGLIMQKIAQMHGINIVGVDIGGATTDVFSVFSEVFNRTVSANYGMSYSISNVFADAGLENVMRWVPFDIDEAQLRNRIKNKMIRPTSIPYLMEDLEIEQAVCREALRLSFEQHAQLATGLKGVQHKSDIGSMFSQEKSGSLVDLMSLDMLIGSGGVLSHAPQRWQTASMLIDAFLPWGVTALAVDSIFMMPQLGVLSTILPEAATNVFEKDCLIELGTCIAPVNTADQVFKEGDILLKGEVGGESIVLHFGEMIVKRLEVGREVEAVLSPSKGLDLGAGSGKTLEKKLKGGVVGLIFDGRGRNPFQWPKDRQRLIEKLQEWKGVLANG
ncbi:glutamate mutase L [bacterium]|nr:glutamate mutase L [bacterium]